MSRYQQSFPGEWEIEPETGRRFRRIGGNCIEYEMQVYVDGIPVPQSELEAHHARMKEAEARAREEARRAEEAAPKASCPFKDGLSTTCTGEKCALFLNGGCALAQLIPGTPARTRKGQCPISRAARGCTEDCALYAGGCKLTAIKTNESEDT